MDKPKNEAKTTRRSVLRDGVRSFFVLSMGGASGYLVSRVQAEETVWQIDPHKCIACGNCATHCVLEESAAKCVQSYRMCGYCKLCTGFFNSTPSALDTGAENQLCPTGAIVRNFIEDPYFEYAIDESLCIGCAKCVKWCEAFGNASLYLQIRHDRCLNCNECSIALACPSDAISRVPKSKPYRLKIENIKEPESE
ncbi:4Fe-4S binding protein [bacterium]|nr:4Fe-4S binding protein [bacterium]